MADEKIEKTLVKKCIDLNRQLRSEHIKKFGQDVHVTKAATAASSDSNLSYQLSSAVYTESNFVKLASTLYNIPEIGICVDFWKGNIGTKRITTSFINKDAAEKKSNASFNDALELYLNSYQMVSGLPFRVLFNNNAMDYVLYGNEPYFITTKKVEIGKYRFPAMIMPVGYADADISTDQDESTGAYEYELTVGPTTHKDSNVIMCKRAANVFDEFGRSVLLRAVRPIQRNLADNELDRSISKAGMAASFVLLKYGTEDAPRTDDELQELYDSISDNIESGIAFGVVPPDVSSESLMKSSAMSQFNRDKIYEMYIESINYAFGGVLSAVAPKSNTGSSSDRPLIILKNILDAERQARKEQIIDRIVDHCRLLNGIQEPMESSIGRIAITIQTEDDVMMRAFDRGLLSAESYLEERFQSEVFKLRREKKDYSDVIVPRQLPYTSSGSTSSPATSGDGSQTNPEA